MKQWPGVKIKIGSGFEIDEDVILGYPSGRLKKTGDVLIGDQARIRSGSVIYQGVRIGGHLQLGHHVIIREENEIGDSVCIWAGSVIDYGCRIGNGVKIHTNVYVAQYTILEEDVFIAPGVIFGNDRYPLTDYLEGPHVKRGARVGVNSTILPGVVIGEEAMIGAGSVVTKNVPAKSVVAGNPARVIATVDEINQKREKLLKTRLTKEHSS